MSEQLYFNGIDGDTGDYDLPPMSAEELMLVIRGEMTPENLTELRFRAQRAKTAYLGVKEGVDATKLDEAGWGVIFPQYPASEGERQKEVDAIREALQPLLQLRQKQAGDGFAEWCQGTDKGFRVGADTKGAYLARHGIGPGPADPDLVPYYLMIVGSPTDIPYRFQSQLDVQYAVGRIHFATLDEYAAYAANVVAVETSPKKLARQAAFFGVANPDDPATLLSSTELTQPLADKMLADHPEWTVASFAPDQATKAALASLLGGEETPSLLFTASHGMKFDKDSPRQLPHQGALLCRDWPGPQQWAQAIPHDFYFAGEDLTSDADLLGLIAFFFACYGGGTPQYNEFVEHDKPGVAPATRPEIAPYPFLAQLPVKMLGRARGALATVGHVERAWSYSFDWGEAGAQTAVFESTFERLLSGHPLGSAIEYFNERYAELSTVLSDELEEIKWGKTLDPFEMAGMWTANNDARGYAIIGDPAVRLPVVGDAEAATERHTITVASPPPLPDVTLSSPAEPTKEEPVSKPTPADPRVAHPYSPAPAPTKELAELRDQHPDLYEAYVQHVKEGYENNGRIFDNVRQAFLRSHYSTVVMYWLLFLIGAGTVITGVVLAVQGNPVSGALFLGVGVAAFVTYFVGRSVVSVEENLIYITWLGVIYNSYWTHLAWATQRDTAQAELDKATTDALQQLATLVDRHAESVKGRPKLRKSDEAPASQAKPAEQKGSASGTETPDTSES